MLYHNNNSKMDGLHVHGGKKIETDTTLELKLHIALAKSSDITTFSSPLHKRMKPSDSPVHDYK
jgi:hypothetical protein